MTEKLTCIERCEYNAIHEDIINQVREDASRKKPFGPSRII